MDIKSYPASAGNYTKGRSKAIKYIVIHYTANNGDTALGNCKYFSTSGRRASAHYFVDEFNIYQSVKDTDTAWHCGGKLQGSGGHTFYGQCSNSNSIGIEMCSDKINGQYVITQATQERAVELTRWLMEKYSIPTDRVIRHYDVTGKICPEPFVRDTAQWDSFKSKLTGKKEEEEVTQEQFNNMMANYWKMVEEEPASSWAASAWDKAKESGVFDGSRPQAALTRQEAAIIWERLKAVK